ncbi:MAG: flagellar protein, partial [Rhodobacteraceae bacterium]|nr:flagellar protein [Paracoccaceae bacterium]
MAISTITTSRTYLTKQVTSLSRALQEKTSQMATGKAGTTYGAVGNNRLMDLQLTQKVSQIKSYQTSITHANLHLETLNLTLDRLENIRLESKAAIDQNDFQLQTDGQTRSQATAEILLYEAVNILNENVAGHYLYGGSDAVTDPVAAIDDIMKGTIDRAGLKTVMDEFYQANLGPNNNGRMDVSALTTNYTLGVPTDSTFTIAEDGAHDFGFDIGTVNSTLSNVTLTGPGGGDPDTFDIQFTGQPALGETIKMEFTLPPAHDEILTLELEADSDGLQEGTFAIGADLEETATNLHAKVTAFLEEHAQTTLKAASDVWAGDSFFDTYNGQEPMRVDGPPFDTATALIAGGATTVNWYTGENSVTDNPRDDKDTIIDSNL